MNKKAKITVVGGGIAGLAAAHRAAQLLENQGRGGTVTLLEKKDRWGGKIISEKVNGLVIEGGPDAFIITKPWAMKACREFNLEDSLHGMDPAQNKTFVLKDGELRPLPEGLMMMIPSKFMPMIATNLLTWPEKFRMGMDFFIPPRNGKGDESLGEFVSRRLGRAAYERLIEPLLSGIYAGDGDQLSLASTFPYLKDLELDHGGLIKGALAVRRKRAQRRRKKTSDSPAQNSRGIFRSLTGGLGQLVDAYRGALEDYGVDLRLNREVREVARTAEGYRLTTAGGEKLDSETLILAAPAFASGEMLSRLAPSLANTMKAIPYVSTATVSLAFDQKTLSTALNGRGYVIPRREGREALACTWTSSKFPHRAPAGTSLLRVFIGRAGQEGQLRWDEDHLIMIARKELEKTLGITAEPILKRAFVWKYAMPQYNLGHSELLASIERSLGMLPGLRLAGNGYQGIGIPDCIRSGREAAEELLKLKHDTN